ncbi:PA3496 family putative envelope integrity protein [Psychrobacter sp. I-STPA10]|uniref:PA3496 family putative envelope integrity protein n=1 Tax=Psychrobacter sp. I-STPA10 TaxID=2585769 RepID=UPI001E2F58CF|nr:hypothetical protein [Psychrobacter sp. I-STPA10]
MSDTDLDDDFDDDFEEDEVVKLVDEVESTGRSRISSLEKRRLIDNLLEEKRLARELKDGFDDDLDDLDDEDFDDDFDDDE